MSTLLLNATGGLSTDGGLTLLDNFLEEARQRLQIKFKFFLGEWFQDRRIGVPYYEKVLIKAPNINEIRRLYREIITTDLAVDTLESLELDFDRPRRVLTISFEATLIDGTKLIFEDFILAENL